jgi:uncharacterized HAD superfamily protein
MKRLRIGVDIDGVLADFTGLARKLCRHMFNGEPAKDRIQTGWGFDSLGITKEQENQMWRRIDETYNWWQGLDPLPNTDLLSSLYTRHQVIFITNRKNGTGWPVELQSAEWLDRHYDIRYPSVLLSDKKGPLAKALELDYFIDDRDKNVREVAAAIGDDKTIMCRWPWQPEFQKFHPNWVLNFNVFAADLLQRDEGRCIR